MMCGDGRGFMITFTPTKLTVTYSCNASYIHIIHYTCCSTFATSLNILVKFFRYISESDFLSISYSLQLIVNKNKFNKGLLFGDEGVLNIPDSTYYEYSYSEFMYFQSNLIDKMACRRIFE